MVEAEHKEHEDEEDKNVKSLSVEESGRFEEKQAAVRPVADEEDDTEDKDAKEVPLKETKNILTGPISH